jgi:hypothetical protein
MFANTIARTLTALGFHAHPHAEGDVDMRAAMATADGEMPTLAEPLPARIPPHMRHLILHRDDALHSYSMGMDRPAASDATIAEMLVATAKPAKARKRANRVRQTA